MNTRRLFALFVLSVVTVAVVGFYGTRLLRQPDVVKWPAKFAVIGVNRSNPKQPVSYLAVADPSTSFVVEVPVNAVVEIPGTGFLRAFHAYRLGGEPMVRSTLGRLFAVDIAYSVVGTGDEYVSVAGSASTDSVPASIQSDLQAALTASRGWERKALTGTMKTCEDANQCFVLDPVSVNAVARLIGGLGTKVFVDPSDDSLTLGSSPAPSAAPTPVATIAPGSISVDVLNGGKVELAATKTANRLKSAGYIVQKIGDRNPQDLARSVVYYKADSRLKAEQIAAVFGYAVEALPSSLSSSASVVVVLGDDAKV